MKEKRRGERGISMGYDLDAITKRDGSKMKIDFSEGVNRPVDPQHAAKLSSEVGMHVRKHMPLEPKWKNYNKKELSHIVPEAVNDIKVNHQTCIIFKQGSIFP